MEQGNLFGEVPDPIKQQAAKDLVRLADMMETAEPGSQFYKEL